MSPNSEKCPVGTGFLKAIGIIVLATALPLKAVAAKERAGEFIETETGPVRLVEVVSGLENPWAVAFLPDGRMLVTERPGRINLIEDGAVTSLSGLPQHSAGGQGGMLDVAVHPDYENNGWIYFTYVSGTASARGTALARARIDGDRLVDLEELFAMNRLTRGGRHFGSRIAFAHDGTLLMTIGDRGDPDRSQDRGDHAGSTLRLSDDGTVPGDNPFLDDPEAVPELFSYGHRNSQGLFVHPETGDIWQSEHGPRGGDELNRVEAGKNYGWPVVSHGVDYATRQQIGVGREAPGKESPLEYWSPAIAPSGTAVYTGDAFPEWRGNIFIGSLVQRHVRRLVMDGDEVVHQEVLLPDAIGRVRDVRQHASGAIYLVTDETPGGVYRLEPVD